MNDDDFSPIHAEDRIERTQGLVGRFRRRTALAPVGHGFQRYLIDDDGRITGGLGITSGEKYWTRGTAWVIVDVSAHHLTIPIEIAAPTGEGSYHVSVALSARVDGVHAEQVVRDRVVSVRDVLRPHLVEEAKAALRTQHNTTTGSGDDAGQETAIGLTRQVQEAEEAIRARLMGARLGRLPEWLSIDVLSVEVEPDAQTRKHMATLVGLSRHGVVKSRKTDQDIQNRKRWREELTPHLQSRHGRAIEVALENPTAAAIQSAVDQLDRVDAADRGEMLAVLEAAIAGDYVDDLGNAGTAIRAIVDGLHNRDSIEAPKGPLPPAPSAGPKDDETAEAEVVDDGDDWADR